MSVELPNSYVDESRQCGRKKARGRGLSIFGAPGEITPYVLVLRPSGRRYAAFGIAPGDARRAAY